MNLKGTITEKNLLASFAGESQARNRYTYFAKIAKKEGYEQIAAIFEETALNEMEHAKKFFKYLEGGVVEITASYPAGQLKSTLENLKASAAGEEEEWQVLYKAASEIAEKEGFPEIAKTFSEIAKVEAEHEKRYRKLIANIENTEVFSKKTSVKWHCRNCGYVLTGNSAPDMCPACKHPQSYFELFLENY
ncbi:MAG: rubrerythrin family protein [Candidatus Margulisiibacteriota bacterium]|jgi:rubrerythrin